MKKKNLNRLLIFSFILITSIAKANCVYEQPLQAKEFGVGLILTWSTSSEDNNQTFVIEKSDNDSIFSNIGNVKGGGTIRAKKSYNFLDVQVTGKKIFYRLKQVDFDGTYSYSEVLIVNKKLDNNLVVVQTTS